MNDINQVNEIESILDEFDFNRVQTAMKALDWKYYNSADAYPSIGELRRMARQLLLEAYVAPVCPEWTTGTGGFEVTRYMYIGDTKKYISLKFVLTEWNNYD
jgi:hypothetical protein